MITEVHRHEVEIYDTNGEPGAVRHERTWTQRFALYRELSEEQKRRAREDAINREWSDPYGHYQMRAEEIWHELQEIEKSTPIRFHIGRANEDVFATTKFDWLYDYVQAYKLEDSGDCYSIDLCEIWNRNVPLLEVAVRACEFAEEIEDYDRWSRLTDAATAAYEAIVERIGDEMASYAKETMRSEQDYYTSHEFWDEWLDDGETYFEVG